MIGHPKTVLVTFFASARGSVGVRSRYPHGQPFAKPIDEGTERFVTQTGVGWQQPQWKGRILHLGEYLVVRTVDPAGGEGFPERGDHGKPKESQRRHRPQRRSIGRIGSKGTASPDLPVNVVFLLLQVPRVKVGVFVVVFVVVPQPEWPSYVTGSALTVLRKHVRM